MENIRGFGKQEMQDALAQLGRMALERGYEIELIAVGGTAMVLAYSARVSTKDVDVVVLSPDEVRPVRELARVIARDRGWPDDWLNDGAKGFLHGLSEGPMVFSAPGIRVRIPDPAQLLAMKLRLA